MFWRIHNTFCMNHFRGLLQWSPVRLWTRKLRQIMFVVRMWHLRKLVEPHGLASLQQKKLSRLQVSEDPPHHLHECLLWESGTRSPGRVLRSLLKSPPRGDLPLPKDTLSLENVHRSNPLSPRHADLLLLKDALSAEGMQQSMLILQLHDGRLQEKDALLPGIVFRKWIRECLARWDHLWLIQWLQHPQWYVWASSLIITVTKAPFNLVVILS